MSLWFEIAVLGALALIWFAIAEGVNRLERMLTQIRDLSTRNDGRS